MRFLKITLLAIGFALMPLGVHAASPAKVGTPVRIEIPKLGVSAPVEAKGLRPDKTMPGPTTAERVVWYNRGTRPGNPGNSVMYGHLTNNSFGPAVFMRLRELKPKDQMVVTDEFGVKRTFRVTKLESFLNNQLTFHQLGEPSQYSHLNIYTCAGKWNPKTRAYTHFLVVYTTLVAAK